MLEVSEARARVLEAVEVLASEEVVVADAHGRVTAKDLVAPHGLPRFDNSAMDGYAVRGEDVSAASEASPVELEVTGEVRAGGSVDEQVTTGTALRIMTGAPVPEGADAIVPVEVTEEVDGVVRISAASDVGDHVRRAGGDIREGQVVIPAGTMMGPGEMAVAASLGLSPLAVHKRPVVSIFVTGDELVPPEQEPASGQIRDSNGVALAALVSEAGGEPVLRRSVPDGLEDTKEALLTAAEGADLVISSGGVSMGRYDFVRPAVEALGRIDMWKVAMQPGKPVVLGTIGKVPFLGLPGNPVSIHVGFEQFVRPALRKMQGLKTLLRPTIEARISEEMDKRSGRLHFVRVRLTRDGNGWVATPIGSQGSHIQTSLVECHGLARFGIDETHLDAGSEVTVEVWSIPGREG